MYILKKENRKQKQMEELNNIGTENQQDGEEKSAIDFQLI